MIAYPILTKTFHATHDWQRLKPIWEGTVYKCSHCGALKAVTCDATHYTVPGCDIEQSNEWYATEQKCVEWGAKEE